MPDPQKYLLLSLPTSIAPSNSEEDALNVIQATTTTDIGGFVTQFKVPHFKIGTLDALVGQADDLAKLEQAAEGVVAKIGDTLRIILDGDVEKIDQQKVVLDKPADHYLRTFTWNRVKYRADKPIGELIDSLQKELIGLDNDVKGKYNQYNSVKTALTALQRKQTGNLATKSLTPVVDPSLLVTDSEYLTTHLIVVPKSSTKDFLRTYETLSPMVVPRSALEITTDDELALFAVTTFKKHAAEFVHKCREHKWTPREFQYVEGGKEEEKRELERTEKEERKLWGEVLRLARTGWGEAVMVWVHVMCLRVFVETVLRYGLPLEFVAALVKTTPKSSKKAKANLDNAFSYLGGNAIARDKKGKAVKEDGLAHDMGAAGVAGDPNEYTPYVYYEFSIE